MAKCVVVLADNGEVYGWGSNEYGQVNRNTLAFIVVASIVMVSVVMASRFMAYILMAR